jgi:serine/threonine protein phosphatase PrpC
VTKIPCTASNIVRHVQMPDSFFSSYQLQPVPEQRAPIMPLQSSCCTSQGALLYKPNEDGCVVIDDLQTWLHSHHPDFDRHIEEAMCLKYGRVAVYAVIDGHSGASCKDFLCQNLPIMIARELVKKDCSLQNIEVVLTRSFAFLDARLIRVNDDGKRICDNGDGRSGSSGAVAVVALVTSGEIITAHVGDCRAMLCRAQRTPSGQVSGCEALEMTTVTFSHSPLCLRVNSC